MKHLFLIWLLPAALLACGVVGCRKSSGSQAGWPAGYSLYMVGMDSGKAVYWKNGVKTVLGPGVGEGITLSGSSVYVGGIAGRTVGGVAISTAAYWKDGVEYDLEDTVFSYAFQPVVAGGDVYVPGFIFGPSSPTQQVNPVYWKNGRRVYLGGTVYGSANGMFIQDTDIYVAGEAGQVGGTVDTAIVWKNGQRIANFYNMQPVPFTQIQSSGGNIYLTGWQGYYINFGQYVKMNSPTPLIQTNSMFLNGLDIYVAGIYDSAGSWYAAYWKNGVMTALPNYAGTANSAAIGIVVAGSDVYAVGSVTDSVSPSVYQILGVYWKNGVEKTLSANGYIFGIAMEN
jgi:hypothetical protein